MISVIAMDKCRSSASKKDFLKIQLPVKFPANPVAPSNEVWNIGDIIFAPILVQWHALTAIQKLQLYAILFRNVLASNQRAVVEEATYIPLIRYENSLWTKKQPAIFGGVVGRSSRLQYAKDSDRACNIKWFNKVSPVLASTTGA